MSSNNDNAMARFLFAILEQKNLKDIDWNAVAHNPILAQEITNGHAARMRWSRFKSSLLGIEPQRRNRTGASKSKVTKPKKGVKTKKEKEEQTIKPDPNAAPDAQQGDSKALPPKIKYEAVVKKESRENPSGTFHAPAEMPPISMPEAQMHFHHDRLLTPCSDTDLFAASPGYSTSPVNEMIHSHEPSPFNYPGAGNCHVSPDQVPSSWQSSPSYAHSPLRITSYEMDSYNSTTSPFCDHHHAVAHPAGFGIAPSEMMPPDHSHVM